MAERIWDKFLTEHDREVFGVTGLGAAMGIGSRPALLIIDVSYNFVGRVPKPLLEAAREWRGNCGENGWATIPVMRKLIDACHNRGLPVIYSTNTRRKDGFDGGSWLWKSAREMEDVDREIRDNEIVSEIAPSPQDIIIYKTKPSAFFGTPLLSFLISLKVDSLFVCGCTTSGCVRGTVIEAFSNNFRVQVVEDGCFDRTEVSHAINLFDMNAKYADVIKGDEALAAINKFQRGLFDLPGQEKVTQAA